MKGLWKRSEKQPKRRKQKTARGKRIIIPRRHGKEAGWAELDYQEAISYWTKSQGAR